ncbi:MAG: 1-deoxy-D-xylulose-5-phosphate reductoisomerase [Telmatospirillum sp.]|nr:1-deoxy-D-xylulose-5-phosphate reductoisomerase [Telmatospirillum sp.]
MVHKRAYAGMAMKRVTILGSTGSVGCNTAELLAADPQSFAVEALVANRNAAKLAQQARTLRAKRAVVADESCYGELRDALSGSGIEAAAGAEAVVEAALMPAEFVCSAIVGAAGLPATLAAIRRGATIGLANKETLVCAGALAMAEVRQHGATLVPVDSEHSAIFQVLDLDALDRVEKIVLTASGGPFRTWSLERMASVTPSQAVAHPNWSMGAKISVDSATMMNKGLEVIEAFHLFPVGEARIEAIVHPQSVVHSMVAYADGSVLAQLGTPDMRTPIAVALAWPGRMATTAPRLDLAKMADLTFETLDYARFPAFKLARLALQAGGAAPTILNAANEVAVAAFLGGGLGFLGIADCVSGVLDGYAPPAPASIADVVAIDALARVRAREWIDAPRPRAVLAAAESRG